MIDIDYYRLLSIIGSSINFVWLHSIFAQTVSQGDGGQNCRSLCLNVLKYSLK